jgi:hypothetical protein
VPQAVNPAADVGDDRAEHDTAVCGIGKMMRPGTDDDAAHGRRLVGAGRADQLLVRPRCAASSGGALLGSGRGVLQTTAHEKQPRLLGLRSDNPACPA